MKSFLFARIDSIVEVEEPPVPQRGNLGRRVLYFVWICTNDEMEDISIGFVLKYRSFPFGEGEGGWGLMNKDQKVQECDARKV